MISSLISFIRSLLVLTKLYRHVQHSLPVCFRRARVAVAYCRVLGPMRYPQLYADLQDTCQGLGAMHLATHLHDAQGSATGCHVTQPAPHSDALFPIQRTLDSTPARFGQWFISLRRTRWIVLGGFSSVCPPSRHHTLTSEERLQKRVSRLGLHDHHPSSKS